jgi:glycosyltransferase involved in cell wall biosynthesis
MGQINKKIQIVHVEFISSSAGKQAYRLTRAFNEMGYQSKVISLHSDATSSSGNKQLGLKAKWISRLDFKIQAFLSRKTNKEFGSFYFPALGTNISRMREIKEADVIYLHWILNGFLNLSNIEKIIKLNKPVIIFLHDMWPITGGCFHSFGCSKYSTHCYNCQVFQKNNTKDLSFKGFNKKAKLYGHYNNLYFVSPSKWLYNCTKEAALTRNKPIYHIPNIVNTDIFKPFDQIIAREILNVPDADIVIAFGAVSLNSPYKGWSYLQQALQILKTKIGNKNIQLLIFGTEYNEVISNAVPFPTKFLGYLKDDYSTSLVYNAANLVITPSLAENFPLVIFEALCCGTPVVGFNTGGIPDLILHKENGYLARYKDAEDIVAGIQYCLDNKIKGYLPEELLPNLSLLKHQQLIHSLLDIENDTL